ncbi:hypothetical protein ABK905_10085 [Acerihabitans sp. KWT182]|uniref:Uncharacterized protein n=1 Tax=Acerihabitans sp. KWT182 TaxID=3157919 RepID=A0AAU7QDD6_9GAMM
MSHKLDEVLAVCDEATVMCGGRVIYHADKQHLSKQAIVDAIVGDAAAYQGSSRRRDAAESSKTPYLSVSALTTPRLKSIRLSARRGGKYWESMVWRAPDAPVFAARSTDLKR